mmetsp:Transcript_35191/g.64262  ORF Transcript_35191/g.64262 Transcript_35191/m.64262 type:complete len:221 (-) Transcript_35191:32-694(-)
MCTSAPWFRSSKTTPRWPFLAALCKAVTPKSSWQFASSPAASLLATAATSPRSAARTMLGTETLNPTASQLLLSCASEAGELSRLFESRACFTSVVHASCCCCFFISVSGCASISTMEKRSPPSSHVKPGGGLCTTLLEAELTKASHEPGTNRVWAGPPELPQVDTRTRPPCANVMKAGSSAAIASICSSSCSTAAQPSLLRVAPHIATIAGRTDGEGNG